MKKYLIDKKGIHEIPKEQSTKKHLKKYKFLGYSNLNQTDEKVKVFGNNAR